MNTKMPEVMSNLPECGCFTSDPKMTWARCCDMARASTELIAVFDQLTKNQLVCNRALPYLLDVFLISALTYIAKRQAPAVEFGSQEIEWEVERLLKGLEARVLARVTETYARSREAGLTEAKVAEMRTKGEL